MRYWLMKSEPSVFTIEDLENSPLQTVKWIPTKGIRNYQARNFMRDDMSLGDLAFFYQSNCDKPGIVGIMKISRLAYPDPLQFIEGHKYFDPKSSIEKPRWLSVNVTLIKKIPLIELKQLRAFPKLKSMLILREGNRLSITPVLDDEWKFITNEIN
ncbi:MAG: EVE domain-containing protein [Nitrosomonadales bacterium]|nr:EVE domain-containing protein [Nitrosomonadales bacterium]MBT5149785.1 EVE domain-containing protein [Nitrosomonadales bacterium]